MTTKFTDYEFPSDRLYLINKTPGHFWIKTENDTVTLGLSDFFQKRIGELKSFSSTAAVGKTVTSGKTLGIVKAKNYSAVLKHPLSAEVVEINQILDNPKLINKSPYTDGWIVKLKGDDLQKDLNESWVKPDTKEFKKFIELEIKNNALLPDDCCPDFLGDSGVVRRRRKK